MKRNSTNLFLFLCAALLVPVALFGWAGNQGGVVGPMNVSTPVTGNGLPSTPLGASAATTATAGVTKLAADGASTTNTAMRATDTRVSQAATDNATQGAAISTAQTDVTTLTSTLAVAQSDVATLTTAVGVEASSNATQGAALSQAATDNATQGAAIADADPVISQSASDVETLTTALSTAQSDIVTLTAEATTNASGSVPGRMSSAHYLKLGGVRGINFEIPPGNTESLVTITPAWSSSNYAPSAMPLAPCTKVITFDELAAESLKVKINEAVDYTITGKLSINPITQ